jgi:hypothetical protein
MDEATFDHLTHLIVESLIMFEGLNETKVANKLVCFGANRVIVFQGLKLDVTTQLMQKHVPFVSGVHCMTHHTNLIVQTLHGLTLVAKIITSFVGMYNFFAHNPNQALEASKLNKLLE